MIKANSGKTAVKLKTKMHCGEKKYQIGNIAEDTPKEQIFRVNKILFRFHYGCYDEMLRSDIMLMLNHMLLIFYSTD